MLCHDDAPMVRPLPFLVFGLALGTLFSGCGEDGIRDVWIMDASPRVAPPGGRVTLVGTGFGTARAVADEAARDLDRVTAAALESGVVFEGIDAITVGGVPARVFLRRNGRVDLELPDLPEGSAFVVVWTQGIASNAFPIRVLPLISQ